MQHRILAVGVSQDPTRVPLALVGDAVAIVLNATAKALPFCNKASNDQRTDRPTKYKRTASLVWQFHKCMTPGVIHRTHHTLCILPVISSVEHSVCLP